MAASSPLSFYFSLLIAVGRRMVVPETPTTRSQSLALPTSDGSATGESSWSFSNFFCRTTNRSSSSVLLPLYVFVVVDLAVYETGGVSVCCTGALGGLRTPFFCRRKKYQRSSRQDCGAYGLELSSQWYLILDPSGTGSRQQHTLVPVPSDFLLRQDITLRIA